MTNELVRCVDDVIVVDNGSIPDLLEAFLPSSASWWGCRASRHRGAQNRGVAEARLRDASHVLSSTRIVRLTALVDGPLPNIEGHRRGCRVAAIGPPPYDKRLSRPNQRSAAAPIAVDHLISSASLIATDVRPRRSLREDCSSTTSTSNGVYVPAEGLRCYRARRSHD